MDGPLSAAGRDEIDWNSINTARTREQIKTSDTYSRFVEFMRVALFAGAAVLVISVVLYSSFWGRKDGISIFLPSETDKGQDLHMTNPIFIGHDSGNRPIEVTAERAVQDVENPDLVHLEKIKGKLQIKPSGKASPGDLTQITLAARQGNFNTKSENILLQGNVQLRSNTGYLFAAQEVEVDLQQNEIRSSKPVHGEGELINIDAETFRVWDNGNHILFSGNVKTRFFPDRLNDQTKSGEVAQ